MKIIDGELTNVNERDLELLKQNPEKFWKGVLSIGSYAFKENLPLTELEIPSTVTGISRFAISCDALKKLSFATGNVNIAQLAFMCKNLKTISVGESVGLVDMFAFVNCPNLTHIIGSNKQISAALCLISPESKFKYIYLCKNGQVVLSTTKSLALNRQSFACMNYKTQKKYFANQNYLNNFYKAQQLRQKKKDSHISDTVAMVFPSSEIDNYFVNKNHKRWRDLVNKVKFNQISDPLLKHNSLTDLLKIYYALGGFSSNQGEQKAAFDYIVEYVAVSPIPCATPEEIGKNIHLNFSRIVLNGPYCPEFAKFFMKHYKNSENFMTFHGKNLLCSAHNIFPALLKTYPNKTVSGNHQNSLITPNFVADYASRISYAKVLPGNGKLAEVVGLYSYSQSQFEHIQNIYEKAKKIKDNYIISADKSDEEMPIQFRLLEKDDPLGFVIGDITNCCQHIGGNGESCVQDGFINPSAGFMVFESSIMDKSGLPTGQKRILGQVYLWYDPETKTICFDNIEIPRAVIDDLRYGDKNNSAISSKSFLKAIEKSAEAIMNSMNKTPNIVNRVTIGESYNDLQKTLADAYQLEENPIAKHRNYCGYTDAGKKQFVIKQKTSPYVAQENKFSNSQTKEDVLER